MSQVDEIKLEIRKVIAKKRVRGRIRELDMERDIVLIDGRQVGHCRRRKGAAFIATTSDLSESEIRQVKQMLAEHHARVIDGAAEDDAEAVINNLERQVAVPPAINGSED